MNNTSASGGQVAVQIKGVHL